MKKLFYILAIALMTGSFAACDNQQATQQQGEDTVATATTSNDSEAVPGDPNKRDGEKFLAENAKKEGVITTESGLQYIVLQEGNDVKPTATSEVTVHYTGKLINGKVFDSSVERGEPATFPLNGVIKGWTEGLQLMGEGAKYRFFIPQELAYGERGAGNDIPPYSALIFDVELIKVGK